MSYSQTELLKAISKTSGVFAEAEMRELKKGALGIFRANEPRVFTSATALKQSDSQPTTATLFKRDYKESENFRSATPSTNDIGGTMEKNIVYATKKQTFSISHKLADRNQYSYQEILNDKVRQAFLNLYRDENKLIVDWLTLNKTQVAAGDGMMSWNATDFVYENSLAEKEYFGQNLQAVMRANAYEGAYDIITDQRLFSHLQRLGYNGSQNADNTAAQLNGLTPVEEVTVENSTYGGFGFAFAKGLIGMTSWIPKKNREGDGSIDGVAGLFGTMIDPVYGGNVALRIVRKAADTHLSGGERQDIVDTWEISRDNSIGGAYLSVENESPVFAAGQLKV